MTMFTLGGLLVVEYTQTKHFRSRTNFIRNLQMAFTLAGYMAVTLAVTDLHHINEHDVNMISREQGYQW